MSKTILIVESDLALSQSMRAELEACGYLVEETSDGKGSVDRVRRTRPDLVVLEVELSAGQNGYILCGKLKKDDDLKRIPVIIVGNPDGFAAHRKLPKMRADDYVSRPVDLSALVQSVGALIGFPEPAADQGVEEGVSLSDLMEPGAEEIEVEADGESTLAGDPELDMLDAAFEDATSAEELAARAREDDAFSALDSLDDEPQPRTMINQDPAPVETYADDFADEEEDRTVVGFLPDAPTGEHPSMPGVILPDPFSPPPSYGEPQVDPAELRSLRTRVTELQAAVQDGQGLQGDQEGLIRELEERLAAREAELEAARAGGGEGNRDQVFALRGEANKKDKEIVRLRTEINDKDLEISDLKDKGLQLEQQLSESSGELARKDAQIKTLQARADQLSAERKRFDQQLLAAKEEARTSSATLTTLQSELDDLRGRHEAACRELEELRNRSGDLESELRQARDENGELRQESGRLRSQHDAMRRELDEARNGLELSAIDLDAARNQLSSQAAAFGEEASGMRRRISELEQSGQRHEERVARFYGKLKEDEKIREKTRKALNIALQLLNEQQQTRMDEDEEVEVDVDEPVEV
jgi:DNA-binding response OmpR family regulator/predicted  nucleic acid-binding Zn-ribbon protein